MIGDRGPDKPWVLDVTDQGLFRDDDGVLHDPLIQHRRVVVLSFPKWIDPSVMNQVDVVDAVLAGLMVER